ncbi:MAG TPA: TetR/AcrR family transcriptional regulator [Acidimicrobiales bacterium]
MRDSNNLTSHHIIEVTSKLLNVQPSGHIKITEIARAANVAIPTIYYHFGSKERLVAHAQRYIYNQFSTANLGHLMEIEMAVATGDQTAFWDAVCHHVDMTWSRALRDEAIDNVQTLLDIWSDANVRREYLHSVDERYARWLVSLLAAKEYGWIDSHVEVEVLLVLFWSATLGQTFINSRARSPISQSQMVAYIQDSLRKPELQ